MKSLSLKKLPGPYKYIVPKYSQWLYTAPEIYSLYFPKTKESIATPTIASTSGSGFWQYLEHTVLAAR
jgi:hypothetical protein